MFFTSRVCGECLAFSFARESLRSTTSSSSNGSGSESVYVLPKAYTGSNSCVIFASYDGKSVYGTPLVLRLRRWYSSRHGVRLSSLAHCSALSSRESHTILVLRVAGCSDTQYFGSLPMHSGPYGVPYSSSFTRNHLFLLFLSR